MAEARTRYEAYRVARRFDAVDGLRALAAAAVVWHHTGPATTGYFARGVGATTFFVISGFLITWLLLRERSASATISLREFWWRRSLRIFPLYYAVLAVYIVLVAALERGTAAGARFWECLPHYLSFTTNWFVLNNAGDRVIFYFAWSLALQEQFYVVWPVILRFCRRRYAFVVPLAFLLVGDVAPLATTAGWIDEGLAYRIVTSVDSPIFVGVVLAFMLETRRGFRVAHAVAGQAWSAPLAAALVIAPRWFPRIPEYGFHAAVAYLVVACVLAPPTLARLLGNPVARHVGKVSYGIYLLHMLAVNVVRRAVPAARQGVVFALALPLAVLAATASYRWFERRFLKFRERARVVGEMGVATPVPGALAPGRNP